jgi:hypothetical protein
MRIIFSSGNGLNYGLSSDEISKLNNIFMKYNVTQVYGSVNKIKATLHKRLILRDKILEGHTLLNSDNIEKYETPKPLPRIENNELATENVVNIVLDFIDAETPGWNSFYGYKGYCLSLIVDLLNNLIIDARGETAS